VNREQLAHLLRAASEIVDDPGILIIGSQSVLASFDEDDLPPAATASMEADLAFFDDPDEAKADAVDGAIGELSLFHQTFGVYAQGVGIHTAVLPDDWRERVVLWSNNSTGRARAASLEPHDCVVSKLVANRPKDLRFATALLEAGLVESHVLTERVEALPRELDPRIRQRLRSWLDAWRAAHGA
jgi:hypothetical protein